MFAISIKQQSRIAQPEHKYPFVSSKLAFSKISKKISYIVINTRLHIFYSVFSYTIKFNMIIVNKNKCYFFLPDNMTHLVEHVQNHGFYLHYHINSVLEHACNPTTQVVENQSSMYSATQNTEGQHELQETLSKMRKQIMLFFTM